MTAAQRGLCRTLAVLTSLTKRALDLSLRVHPRERARLGRRSEVTGDEGNEHKGKGHAMKSINRRDDRNQPTDESRLFIELVREAREILSETCG